LPSISAFDHQGILQRSFDEAHTTLRVGDDYLSGEIRPQQTGANDVLTFTFTSEVELIVVESEGSGTVSRADPFGGTPTSLLGIPCRHEVPIYMPIRTTQVKVWSPIGAYVNVYGFRR